MERFKLSGKLTLVTKLLPQDPAPYVLLVIAPFTSVAVLIVPVSKYVNVRLRLEVGVE
jgi:hypothetical protein